MHIVIVSSNRNREYTSDMFKLVNNFITPVQVHFSHNKAQNYWSYNIAKI